MFEALFYIIGFIAALCFAIHVAKNDEEVPPSVPWYD